MRSAPKTDEPVLLKAGEDIGTAFVRDDEWYFFDTADPTNIRFVHAPDGWLPYPRTPEEAERRYMESGLVAHRKSLAYTGRDLTKQVVANLVGSPDLILEKIDGLKKIGVDHACALMIPADSMAEFEDQVEWFAKVAL